MAARLTYFLGFFIIIILLLTSLYLQFYHDVQPCPLCSLQRIAFVVMGIGLLLGYILYSQRVCRFLAALLTALSAFIGLALAARQIWLQHFPWENDGECGVSLQYMLHVLPVNQVLQKIFAGSAECTQRGFELLSFNIAEWSLFWFSLFIVLSIYLLFDAIKKK